MSTLRLVEHDVDPEDRLPVTSAMVRAAHMAREVADADEAVAWRKYLEADQAFYDAPRSRWQQAQVDLDTAHAQWKVASAAARYAESVWLSALDDARA